MELEKTKKQIEIIVKDDELEELILDENGDVLATENVPIIGTTEVEETKIITRLSMPSRKLKIKISNELLQQLEKRQINFKLN
jgi:DNA polymerase-3 subunit alpha